MNIIVISNLFPNIYEKNRSSFLLQEVKALSNNHNLIIIAPIPWVPRIFKKIFKNYLQIPKIEKLYGFKVYHPRYFVIPKIMRSFYGIFYAIGIFKTLKSVMNQTKVDAVISYFAYPDGVGVQLLSNLFKFNHFIKILGSDINLHTKYFLRRHIIAFSLKNAKGIITVSKELTRKTLNLGVNKANLITIVNGIDLNLFKPLEKNEARKILKWEKEVKYVLFVGHLEEVKGIKIYMKTIIHLIKKINLNIKFVFVGKGSLDGYIKNLVTKYNINSYVIIEGEKAHNQIPVYLSACDLLCLPSLSEGTPNIILEAMGVGAKIVATSVGGIPDLLEKYENKILVNPNNFVELAESLKKMLYRKKSVYSINYMKTWDDIARDTTDFIVKKSN